MRVFLDTNVLVSAFATRGLSADVVRAALAQHVVLTSEVVLAELERVLADKLGASPTAIESAVAFMRRCHVEPMPAASGTFDIEDPDDALVLTSALSCRAEVFVTGDQELLELGSVDAMRILSPRQFWESLVVRARP